MVRRIFLLLIFTCVKIISAQTLVTEDTAINVKASTAQFFPEIRQKYKVLRVNDYPDTSRSYGLTYKKSGFDRISACFFRGHFSEMRFYFIDSLIFNHYFGYCCGKYGIKDNTVRRNKYSFYDKKRNLRILLVRKDRRPDGTLGSLVMIVNQKNYPKI